MREILFRGKRVDNGEWVQGSVLETTMSGVYIIGAKTKSKPSSIGGVSVGDVVWQHEVNSETVGQYTGLLDKNGKRIFEGDIFRTCRGVVAAVEWEKECRFLGFTVDGSRKIAYINMEPAVEVIGNIHDKEATNVI